VSRKEQIHATVHIGDSEVTIIRMTDKHRAHVAKVLGIEKNGEVIYLDRLVHGPTETHLGGWRCTGAISTILIREG